MLDRLFLLGVGVPRARHRDEFMSSRPSQMEHGALFYFILGAAVVAVPALTDRLLKGRVGDWLRIALALLVAALTGAIIVLIARPLGL